MPPSPRPLPLPAAALAALLAGCAAIGPSPDEFPRGAEPQTPPTARITSFSGALACMDDLFARSGVPTRYITAISLPDQTGKSIGGGTLNMLISAISEMNRRSNAFQFVYLPVTFSGNIPNPESGRIDLGYLLAHIQVALGGNKKPIDLPDYLLVASVSELDRGVANTRAGIGVDLGRLGIGLSGENQMSALTVDFNVADGKSFKIINGANATNSVTLVSRGAGADLDAKLKTSGGFLTLAVDRADGEQAALRALIQLSAIETLGKVAGVPYQQCLEQRRSPAGTLRTTGVSALALSSPRTRYQVGDRLQIQARASRRMDLFCYYRNARGQVWQVLPTGFQPETAIGPGADLNIPGTPRFDLVFDAPGEEEVLCLGAPPGSAGTLTAALPARVTRTDLQPLAAASLTEVDDAFRAALRLPEDLARATLRVQVE